MRHDDAGITTEWHHVRRTKATYFMDRPLAASGFLVSTIELAASDYPRDLDSHLLKVSVGSGVPTA